MILDVMQARIEEMVKQRPRHRWTRPALIAPAEMLEPNELGEGAQGLEVPAAIAGGSYARAGPRDNCAFAIVVMCHRVIHRQQAGKAATAGRHRQFV